MVSFKSSEIIPLKERVSGTDREMNFNQKGKIFPDVKNYDMIQG
jgi:hypothetical protein